MEQVLFALFTGVAIPVVMMVVKRHYEQRPDEWEQVFAAVALGVAAVAAGVWCFASSQALDPTGWEGWGRLFLLVVAFWLSFIGLVGFVVAVQDAREISKTPPDDRA